MTIDEKGIPCWNLHPCVLERLRRGGRGNGTEGERVKINADFYLCVHLLVQTTLASTKVAGAFKIQNGAEQLHK